MARLFKKSDKPSEAVQRAAQMHGLSLYYVKYYGKEIVPEAKVIHGACGEKEREAGKAAGEEVWSLNNGRRG